MKDQRPLYDRELLLFETRGQERVKNLGNADFYACNLLKPGRLVPPPSRGREFESPRPRHVV
jgi:hypothetical protein